MTPDNLTEFLLARIGEDGAVAERCIQRNQFGDVVSYHGYRHQTIDADLPHGTVAVPAPGFLAEARAKRALVEELARMEEEEMGWDGIEQKVMRYLALPYADHPDYREGWRP